MYGVLALGCRLHFPPFIGGKIEDDATKGFKVAGAIVALDGLRRAGPRVDDAEPAEITAVDEIAQDRRPFLEVSESLCPRTSIALTGSPSSFCSVVVWSFSSQA